MHTTIENCMDQDVSQFLIVRKTYFFKLVLDSLSHFHQIRVKSYSDHAGKNVWNSSRLVKTFFE